MQKAKAGIQKIVTGFRRLNMPEDPWYLPSLVLIFILSIGIFSVSFISKAKINELHTELESLRTEIIIQRTQVDYSRELVREIISELVRSRRVNEDLHRRMERWLDEWDMQEFEATAYTHVATPGVADINGSGDGITATGTLVREGVVAVDPAVIPLGSKVWVQGRGWLSAEDTGGAIRGNRVDIFLPIRGEAMRFGRQSVKVVRER